MMFGSGSTTSSAWLWLLAAAPRVVRIFAGPDFRFYPDVVPVVAGETITFEVTTMGFTAHEFMVGPAADVAADTEGPTVTYRATGSSTLNVAPAPRPGLVAQIRPPIASASAFAIASPSPLPPASREREGSTR